MRLKDIDDIMETIAATPNCDFPTALMIINNATTITPESLVRHGRWIWKGEEKGWICSECKSGCLLNYESDWHKSDWCPHCGTKMDLEAKE